MRNLMLILAFLLLSPMSPAPVRAETVILKTGEKVEGKILEKGDSYIKVDFFGVPLTYYLIDIESIDGQPVNSGQTAASPGDPAENQAASGNQVLTKPYTAKESMRQAISYSLRGDYENAMNMYVDAVYLDPSIHLAMFLRGAAQDKAGKRADALHAYVLVFNVHQLYYLKIFYTRWVVYRQPGLLEQAVLGLDSKIKNDPADHAAYNARGFLYILEGDLAKAMECFNKAISLNPGYSDVYVNRGILNALQGNMDLAQKDYDKAVTINPPGADAYILGLLLLNEKNDYNGSAALFKKAIAADPDNDLVYFAAGIVEQIKNNQEAKPSDEALAYFSKALSINSGSVLGYFCRAYEYSLRNSMDLAIDDYSKAIALYPDDYWSYMVRAKTYQLVGDNDKAARDIDKAQELMEKESSDGASQLELSAGQ
ncbi:MAG: tetratricopeptide repeat protein [Candidatus Omnitrophota bacterium]